MEARLCIPILRGEPPARLPVADRGPPGRRRRSRSRAHLGRRGRRGAAVRGRHPARSPPPRAGAARPRCSAGQADAAAAQRSSRSATCRSARSCASASERVGGSFRARIPAKHALIGDARGDRAPRTTRDALTEAPPASATPSADLRDAPALAPPRAGRPGRDAASRRWDELRAHRLLTALPPTALDDLPDGAARPARRRPRAARAHARDLPRPRRRRQAAPRPSCGCTARASTTACAGSRRSPAWTSTAARTGSSATSRCA